MDEVRSGKVVGTLREMGFCFLSLQNSHSPVQIWPVPPFLENTLDATSKKLPSEVFSFALDDFGT